MSHCKVHRAVYRLILNFFTWEKNERVTRISSTGELVLATHFQTTQLAERSREVILSARPLFIAPRVRLKNCPRYISARIQGTFNTRRVFIFSEVLYIVINSLDWYKLRSL